MTKKAITTELLNIRNHAEKSVLLIKQMDFSLYLEKQKLREMVDKYKAKRIELFMEELRTLKMSWCTLCSKMFPKNKIKFLLLEGREEYSGGMNNSCYGFQNFSNLHHACSECRQSACDKHGSRGAYDELAKDQTHFFAFFVEKRDDGYYARKFGKWIKLEDNKYKLPDLPSQLIESLAKEWHFPPRIEIRDYISCDELVVIHDSVAIAKAV